MYSDHCYDSLLHDIGLGTSSDTRSEKRFYTDEGSTSSFDMSGLDFDRILSSMSSGQGDSVDTASSPLRGLWDFPSDNTTFDASYARVDGDNYPGLRSNVAAPLTAPLPDIPAIVTTVQATRWQDMHKGLGLREMLQHDEPAESTITHHYFASPNSVSSITALSRTSPSGTGRILSTDWTVARGWINYGPDAPPPSSQRRAVVPSGKSSNEPLPSTIRRKKWTILRSNNTSPYSMKNRESAGFRDDNDGPSDTSRFIALNNLTYKTTLCTHYAQFSRYPDDYFYAEVLNDISIRSVCLLCPSDSGTIFTTEHAKTVHCVPGSKRGDSDPLIFLSCCEANSHKTKSLIVKSSALKRHFNSKAHSENRYQCPYCHSAFSRAESVARHLSQCSMLAKILTEEDEKYTSDGGL
ncbi:hypothetical protein EDD18DRAFT_1345312 [Armillaria luteobubalina]|uniref:C2H2-type domain-containing protein n=1 Tax=Armillaria luteobubalina TaxID=153913 RepID=A0AA39TZB4_9AGAR|nr:hypothetical protein EDD18DRAFT_1345312 [Armillaria luteobubalina]